MKNNYTVYKHTSPSGKAYIGITNNYTKRCNSHKGNAKNGCTFTFHRAIRKYSWEAFKHEIVTDNITRAEAIRLEALLIKELNTLVPNGYNILSSAEGIAYSEDRRKLSIANRKESVKGYIWDESQKSWKVSLSYLSKTLHFGTFTIESDAKERAKYLLNLSDSELVKAYEEYKASKQKRNKGYIFVKTQGVYRVRAKINGKDKWFGTYKTEQEAINRVEEVRLLHNL